MQFTRKTSYSKSIIGLLIKLFVIVIVFIKNTIPKIIINPSVDLIINPIILTLPELVFLVNCI